MLAFILRIMYTLYMTTEDKHRIVTPEQFYKGYFVLFEGYRPYSLIKALPDGNYLVKEPSDE